MQGQGAPAVQARQPIIPLQIDDIKNHIASLTEQLHSLQVRLRPICGESLKRSDNGEKDGPTHTLMAGELNNILHAIKQLELLVGDITSTIEI